MDDEEVSVEEVDDEEVAWVYQMSLQHGMHSF